MKRSFVTLIAIALLLTSLACSLTKYIPYPDTVFPDPDGAQPLPATTAMPPGLSREHPYPINTRVIADHWEFEVLESIRGTDALRRLMAANQFNDAPPEGREYLLLHISVTCTYADLNTHAINKGDFFVTGDRYTRYRAAYNVTPEPGLNAELRGKQEFSGWVSFLVTQGEGNLMLIFHDIDNYEEDNRPRYLALSEGASLLVPERNYSITPAETGTESSDPATLGQTVSTLDFEVRFDDVIRGSEAWSLLLEANPFNDPPDEGMEYVLLKVWVRNTSIVDDAIAMDNYDFSTIVSEGDIRSAPAIVEPEPQLDVYLYPGGEAVGWITLLVWEGQQSPVAVFKPDWRAVSPEWRYLDMQ